jgi:hypothetical protein
MRMTVTGTVARGRDAREGLVAIRRPAGIASCRRGLASSTGIGGAKRHWRWRSTGEVYASTRPVGSGRRRRAKPNGRGVLVIATAASGAGCRTGNRIRGR